MPYIAAAALLCLVPVSQIGRVLRLAHGLSEREKVRGAVLATVTLVCGLATWLPVAATAFVGPVKQGGIGPHWLSQMESLVMVAFVGALVACFAYATTIAHQLRAQHAPYVAEGAAVVCALAAAYVAFAAIDSHLFFSVERAEIVELQSYRDEALRSRSPASAHCERGAAFLLASFKKSSRESPLTIRCPKTIVLGAGTAQPFLPWPSYDQVTVFPPRP